MKQFLGAHDKELNSSIESFDSCEKNWGRGAKKKEPLNDGQTHSYEHAA